MSSTIEIKKIVSGVANNSSHANALRDTVVSVVPNTPTRTQNGKSMLKENRQKQNARSLSARDLSLLPGQCANILGVSRRSIYNYLAANSSPCYQFKGKPLISRESLNAIFDGSHLYELRPNKEKKSITEFYTTKEVLEKFGISNSWLFRAAKENNFPKTTRHGKTLWSKEHIDRFFAKQQPKADISEWYTAAEIQERYGMTLSAIYNLVSKERIPKMKIGCEARYSKKHFDIAKGMAVPDEPEYYTMTEAMAHFNMTRDQLYHYIKTYGITKVKVGRIIKISKQELDNLFAPPMI